MTIAATRLVDAPDTWDAGLLCTGRRDCDLCCIVDATTGDPRKVDSRAACDENGVNANALPDKLLAVTTAAAVAATPRGRPIPLSARRPRFAVLTPLQKTLFRGVLDQ